MLLGFVNKAVEYLDNHINEDIDSRLLAELRNIDLDALKEELRDNLDLSLGTMQSTVNTLLHAGEEAFDDFISHQKDRMDLTSELNKVFDGNYTQTDNDIDSLLEYYSLDKNIDVEEDLDVFEEAEEEVTQENETVEEVTETVEEAQEIQPEVKPVTIEEANDYDEISTQETPFVMSEEDDALLAMIAENVNKVNNGEDLDSDSDSAEGQNQELDNIFNEVVAHEDNPDVQIDEPTPTVITPFTAPVIPIVETYEPDEDVQTMAEPVDKDDIIKMVKDIQTSKELYFSHVKEDFAPVDVPEENEVEEPVEKTEEEVKQEQEQETVKEETKEDVQSGYVSALIDDLRAKMVAEDKQKAEAEQEYRQVYDRIHKVYPYLSSGFIRSVYDLKESLANDYPLNVKIIILHRCVFKEVENLRQFVEIALNHGYSINADEDKLIVDVFKEYTNTDGKIITSIFEVANQSAILNGGYDGYRVMFAERV